MNINGFNNIGNSCYFNSALQLARLVFMQVVNDQNINDKIKDKSSSLYLINNVLANNTNYNQLYDFIIKKLNYNRYSQEDSVEAYTAILDEINEVISDKDNICTAFSQLIKCTNCNYFNICDEQKEPVLVSNNLIASNKPASSFVQFLGNGLKKEPLSTSYKCNCNNHNKDISIQMVLTKMPKFFSIKANRCRYGSSVRNRTILEISDNFNITTPEDLKSYYLGTNRNTIKNKYNLCGIIMHHGTTINSGHYTAYVKVNNLWYHCNDITVAVDLDFDLNDIDIRSNCYLLLYQKE